VAELRLHAGGDGRPAAGSIAAQARRLQLLARQTVASLQAGGQRSVFRGEGMEFDEVREYAVGDDARLIDWNVTSRMGSPFTKVFREERELNLVLVVDVSRSLLSGDGARRDQAAWIVAILAHAVQRTGDPVSAYLFSDRRERWLPARRGRGHPLRIAGEVLAIEPHGRGSDLGAALRAVADLLHRRATCVLVSDFETTGFWPQLALLRRRHEVVAIRVRDAGDGDFPAVGGVDLQDPESGRVTWVSGRSRRFRTAYRAYWDEHFRGIRAGCHRHRVDLLEIATGEDPGAALAAFFRRRGRSGRGAAG
jgi:uncharacterized protein (DUF58 family)